MTEDWRDGFAANLAIFGLVVVLLSELLSGAFMLTRSAVTASWSVILISLFVYKRIQRHPGGKEVLRRYVNGSILKNPITICLFGFAAVTLFLAISSASAHVDPNAYHLPRVRHWIQNHSLAPYPTHTDRQIWIGPGAEYFLLHLQLLTGWDRAVSLPQWAAYVATGSIASLMAKELGAEKRGQLFAAVFAMTIPMAVTQASGGHVDGFASLWLALSITLLLRLQRIQLTAWTAVDSVALGAASGVAVLSKTTNAIFLVPFVIWTAISLGPSFKTTFARGTRAVFLIAATAATVTGGWIYRNVKVWNNPLGNARAYHLTNAAVTPPLIVSNAIRNASLHLNSTNDSWNRELFMFIEKVHDKLGLSVSDPRITYRDNRFGVSKKYEDEAASGNPVHLLLISCAVILSFLSRQRRPGWFLLCIFLGALFYCSLFRWQYAGSRFHLPLFVSASGAVGAALAGSLSTRTTRALGYLLVALGIPALLFNTSRPLAARSPSVAIPYERQLFPDDSSYRAFGGAVAALRSIGCSKVGLVERDAAPEFPLWLMMERAFESAVEIRHKQVVNPTRFFATDRDRNFRPCAIVSIDSNESFPGMRTLWDRGGLRVYRTP